MTMWTLNVTIGRGYLNQIKNIGVYHVWTTEFLDHVVYTCRCWLGWHFWHTHQTRENVSQTPLHTVSRKRVVQPGNRKTLGTGVNLNVPQVSAQRMAMFNRVVMWSSTPRLRRLYQKNGTSHIDELHRSLLRFSKSTGFMKSETWFTWKPRDCFSICFKNNLAITNYF